MPQPPLPQPQSDPTPITFEQYDEYTPQKLELWDGFYNYGDQDMTGFHLAVLTNMDYAPPLAMSRSHNG